jgi:hypothetical protein
VEGQKRHSSNHLLCYYILKKKGFWMNREVTARKLREKAERKWLRSYLEASFY